jgi:hypothetical protein
MQQKISGPTQQVLIFLCIMHQKCTRCTILQTGVPAQPPAVNAWLAQGKLAYHNREGVHNLTAFDWNNFIRFAKAAI